MNKKARKAAYRLADAALARNPTQTQIRRHADPEVFTPQEIAEIGERARYILDCLRDDAQDLWDES